VAQNAKFEYKVFRHYSGITKHGEYETMLAERLLTAGLRGDASLKGMAAKYLGLTLDKEVRETFYKRRIEDEPFSEEQMRYGATDAYVVLPIRDAQEARLAEHKLRKVADLEFRCLPVVGDMELAGVRVDQAAWRAILEAERVALEGAEAELWRELEPTAMQQTMFGVPAINMRSQKQLLKAFRELGIDLENTLEATLVRIPHPAVKKLLAFREHEKVLSAFGENVLALVNPVTGRIHADFNQLGAEATGRFSCTAPNLQQIPATSEFRTCFVPAPGYKYALCDYSQQELRVLGELSKDRGFAEAFHSGLDLHSVTAANMFKVPYEQVTKDQRSRAKSINFALAYGMGPGGLAGRLEISVDEARDLINKYFAAYPGIKGWLDKAVQQSVERNYARSILGRRRHFTRPAGDPRSDEYRKQMSAIERQSKNLPIQASSADMTKLALVYLRKALREGGYDAHIVLAVHDEIVVEVREEQADEVKGVLEDCMLRAARVFLKSVPAVADAKVADAWVK
jgi:DNA polymerase-1